MNSAAPVFSVDPVELLAAEPGSTIVLTGAQAHHAARVRRLRSGERVDLVDGRGCRACGVFDGDPTSERSLISVQSINREKPRVPRVIVAQALIKGERTDRAIETMTEVGVDEIIPWSAERSIVQWRGEKADSARLRWETLARESAKQSRQAWFPRVHPVRSLNGVCEALAQAELGVVLDGTGQSVSALRLPVTGDVVVVVGPEGGLTVDETSQMREAGGTLTCLGPSVLRSATAATVATVALLSRSQRWPS